MCRRARKLADGAYTRKTNCFNLFAGVAVPRACLSVSQWLFKEDVQTAPVRAKHTRDDKRADRWHNSGGVCGSRDMPIKGSDATPIVRRRYGSIVRNKKIAYRYHEYSQLHVHQDKSASGAKSTRIEEDRSTTVFHVMPKRTAKGRPPKAKADESLQLWQRHPYGRTLLMASSGK